MTQALFTILEHDSSANGLLIYTETNIHTHHMGVLTFSMLTQQSEMILLRTLCYYVHVWLVTYMQHIHTPTHLHTHAHTRTHAHTHTHTLHSTYTAHHDITCQLTRVERFSITSLCSVRVGGPYLRDVARRVKKETQCLPSANTGGQQYTIDAIHHIFSDMPPFVTCDIISYLHASLHHGVGYTEHNRHRVVRQCFGGGWAIMKAP